MPPKRAIKKAKVRSQTFLHPYKCRPIAITLEPSHIEADIEVMNALLVAQRTALQRALQEQILPAPAFVHGAASHDAAAASDSEHDMRVGAEVQQMQQHRVQQQHQHPAYHVQEPALPVPQQQPEYLPREYRMQGQQPPPPPQQHPYLLQAPQQAQQPQQQADDTAQQQLYQLIGAAVQHKLQQLRQQLVAAQQQEAQQAQQAEDQPHPSPSCTFQHQQAYAQQLLTGYALA